MWRFELFVAENPHTGEDRWFWKLVAPNSRTVARSFTGYATKAHAARAAKSIPLGAPHWIAGPE